MSESKKHRELVNEIKRYCKDNFTPDQYISTCFDDGEADTPPQIGNSKPDAYLETAEFCMLGEAKTGTDFDTHHSINQYNDYIDWLKDKPKALLICATEWKTLKSFKTLINRRVNQKKLDIRTTFLKK